MTVSYFTANVLSREPGRSFFLVEYKWDRLLCTISTVVRVYVIGKLGREREYAGVISGAHGLMKKTKGLVVAVEAMTAASAKVNSMKRVICTLYRPICLNTYTGTLTIFGIGHTYWVAADPELVFGISNV